MGFIEAFMVIKTGIVRDERYLLHDTGIGHPECAERLAAVYRMLDETFNGDEFAWIPPEKAAPEDILAVHSKDYLERVAESEHADISLSPDTPVCRDSFQTALLAVGGLFQAIFAVVAGHMKNAMALVRPPGHHAERNRAMGYCLFNNVALGAMLAKQRLGLNRVLIVDWDVHHGNGTQHAFETDASVLFFSMHQFPHFPGSGSFMEVGRGSGEGYTVNIPLPGRYGNGEYVAVFQKILRPMALAFKPELILVSAGFDTHAEDPLGGMRLGLKGFGGMTRILMEIADATCSGRLVLSLEGGYDPAALAESVRAVLLELAGFRVTDVSEVMRTAKKRKLSYVVQRVSYAHRAYWRCFAPGGK
jgi:acetoin utilization deacetylase AcuC-like enzyme